ncbi:MAG: SlyX family protein [Mariniblastus sp.]|nr:SlyX family protein [Mariniblastus sp.]MDG2183330.1 SlyX family protein [Mariniblastus sp.]
MDQSERNRKRITELESSMMHLQNDYESLNEVVLENVQRLEKMRLIIERLESRLRASSESESERKAEDEVPPHY